MSDYYCDFANGDDTTGAGTAVSPWKTVEKCLTVGDGGDTIWIGDGRTDQEDTAQILTAEISWGGAKTTSGDLPIIFRGWEYLGGAQAPGIGDIDGNDAVATLFSATNRPSYVIFYDLKLHRTTGTLMFGSYWNWVSCEIYGAGGTYLIGGSSNRVFISCDLHGPGTSGLGSGGTTVFINNYVHGFTSRGVYNIGSSSVVLFNIFEDCDFTLLSIGAGNRIVVMNNTFDRTGQSVTDAQGLRIDAASENVIILNNLFTRHDADVAQGSGIEWLAGCGSLVYGYNHFFGNDANHSGTPLKIFDLGNDKDGDPEYANRAAGDYTPSASVAEMGWPREWLGLSTCTYIDVGAVQRREDWVQRRTTIDEDVYIDAVAEGKVLLPSAGSFSNTHFASDAVIATSKMLHKHVVSFGQSGGATTETIQIHLVSGATGTIVRFGAGAIGAPTTGDVTVDLEKAGVSVLSAVITIAIGAANRILTTAVISSAALVDGDWLDVVIVDNTSDATGVYAQLEVDETAPA